MQCRLIDYDLLREWTIPANACSRLAIRISGEISDLCGLFGRTLRHRRLGNYRPVRTFRPQPRHLVVGISDQCGLFGRTEAFGAGISDQCGLFA